MATRNAPAPSFRLLSFRLLPPGAAAWLLRRGAEILGIALALGAGWLLIALATWDGADPSFGHATTAEALNTAGRFGAFASDLVFTWVGVPGFLPVLVFCAWARRLTVRHALPHPMWRAVSIPLAVLFLAPALEFAGWPGATSLPAGPGGLTGVLIAGQIADLAFVQGIAVGWVVLALGIPGVVFAAFATALPWTDVATMGRGLKACGVWLIASLREGLPHLHAGTASGIAFLRERLRRAPLPDEDGEDIVPEPAAPKAAPKQGARSRVQQRADTPGKTKRKKPVQQTFAFDPDAAFTLPPNALLVDVDPSTRKKIDEEGLEQNARMLEGVLGDFGIRGEIVDVRPGPVVTLYELEPEAGIRANRVIGLADDIARNMSAISARVAVVPGRTVLGIELPNADREMVALRELMETRDFTRQGMRLPIALGKQISGVPVVEDLANMPHLLVAGTTGSGKSVAVNAMILSLLYRMTPDQCRLIMIDPKMLELSVYDDIPHLLTPVVTEPGKAVMALKWTVREMEQRYRAMQKIGVRNIDGFNKRVAEAQAKGSALTRTVQTGFNAESGEPVFEDEVIAEKPLPYIVVVVDEMADLMLVAGRDIEGAIQRLAQMARAAGIHLIMATQRPSVDVITGTIKANFPSRISFHVTSKIDSRTIIGEQGAEQLLGKGDMLFMRGGGRLTRIHGPFVSDEEVQQVAEFLRRQGGPEYIESVTEEAFDAGGGDPGGCESGADGKDRQLYDQAVFLVTREQKASTSFIQRHLKIGYNRAATIIEQMERNGVVSAANHVGKREVLAASPPELQASDA
ncbi:MAG: DNA translocase FtsK 4TM domain-containing protein [Rhodospirillales bacterium]|nr:DNA translocase FtsK 4TM domain-containing protein [Rhodospirillales bacterium]